MTLGSQDAVPKAKPSREIAAVWASVVAGTVIIGLVGAVQRVDGCALPSACGLVPYVALFFGAVLCVVFGVPATLLLWTRRISASWLLGVFWFGIALFCAFLLLSPT